MHPSREAGCRGCLPPLRLPVADARHPCPSLLRKRLDSRFRSFGALAAILVLVPPAFSLPPPEDLVLKFVSPPAGRPVSGETRVELLAIVPPGAHLVRIEVSI